MATTLTSNPRLAEFVLTEASGQRSRENVVVVQAGTEVKSGTLLTKSGDAGDATFAMDAGATGNPTAGVIVVGADAIAGAYVVLFTAATKFTVEDPNGVTVGTGSTGVAFSKGGLGFTLTAGDTPAIAGDTAKLAVATGTGKYSVYVAAGAAGPADAVLYNYLPVATGDTKAVAFVRDCEVNRGALTGLDAGAEAQLANKGVIVRGRTGMLGYNTPL